DTAYVCNTSGTAPSAPVNLTPIEDYVNLPLQVGAYFTAPDDWLGYPDYVRVVLSSSSNIVEDTGSTQYETFSIWGFGPIRPIEEGEAYYSETQNRFLIELDFESAYASAWNVAASTVYYMAISAVDFGVGTALSNEVVFIPAPDNLALSHSETEATISWATISGSERYNIYYASQPGVTPQNYLTLPDGTLATTTSNSLTVTGLDPEKPYYFVVAAEAAGTE